MKPTYNECSCCAEKRAGEKGKLDLEGHSYRVGLSAENGLTNVCSGNSRVETRCSPDENLVARGEAVEGRGFLRTDEVEVDEVVEKPRDRTVDGGMRGILMCWNCSLRPGGWARSSSVGRIEMSRSDGSDALGVSESGSEGWTIPRSGETDAIVFPEFCRADQTLDGGRDVQFAVGTGISQVWVRN
jgi:hypothetical protein